MRGKTQNAAQWRAKNKRLNLACNSQTDFRAGQENEIRFQCNENSTEFASAVVAAVDAAAAAIADINTRPKIKTHKLPSK